METSNIERTVYLEEVVFYFANLEMIQQSFSSKISSKLIPLIEDNIDLYKSIQSKLMRITVKLLKGTWEDLLSTSIVDLNLMHSQRFMRQNNPANKSEQMEAEYLYGCWMYLSGKMRKAVGILTSRGILPHSIIIFALSIYLEYFSDLLHLLETTPTSVQKQEVFSDDVKFAAVLMENIFQLLTNVSSEQLPDGTLKYRIKWPCRYGFDSLQYISIYRKFQVLRSHFRYLLKVLKLTGKELEKEVNEISSGLYRNRKEVSNMNEILKSSLGLAETFKKESTNLLSSLKEMYY